MSPTAAEEQDIIIRAPRPESFVEPYGRLECAMCGNYVPGWLRFKRRVLGLEPVACIGVVWCSGSKPPSERREGLEAALIGGERNHTCAGIERAHLHCTCHQCGYRWHMAAKNAH